MLNRPLLLKIFVLFLICDPILRSVLIAIEKDFSLWIVIQKTFSLSRIDIFNYWILSPLSGLFLWFVNLPFLILFILSQFYSLYFHINYESFSWPYLSQTPSLTAYALLTVNMLIMIYLILPGSFQLFTDKTMRWWERGSRFTLDEPCFISSNDQMFKGLVKDISLSGASIVSEESLNPELPVVIDVEILNTSYILHGKIVRSFSGPDNHTYGVKFIFHSYLQSLTFRALMIRIGMKGSYPRYR